MNAIHKRQPTLRAAALGLFAGALTVSLAGCKSNQAQSQAPNNQDPATANLAQPYTGAPGNGQAPGQTQVLGQSDSYSPQSSGESYETQAPAPIIRQAPGGAAVNNTQYYPVPQAQTGTNGYAADADYQGYSDAEEAGEQALAETDQAPPPLPEYDQPPAPEDNYIWTPGYWNYASTGYYWVPGVWCAPPFYGALWTPPYWGYSNSHYLFHRGYWGPHVGYYGGINYGFGYIGFGYYGGYWRDHSFFYNRAVTNVNIDRIHNYYQRNVVYDNRTYGPHPDNRVDYVGGRGGLNIQPRPQELAAMREAHYAPLPAQREVRVAAASNRDQFYRNNQGRPGQAFAARPVGAVTNIAAVPHEQPFNHPGGAPNQPGFAGRPGEVNRPGAAPNQPAFNNNRPGTTPNQPGFAGRPGEANRPGTTPNQPGFAGRPGEANRPGTTPQPAINSNNRPGGAAPNQPFNEHRTPDVNRGAQPSQPAFNGSRPTVAPTQPAPGNNRPNDFNRAAQPSQQRPNFQQRAPQAEPQAQPQPQQQRPNFQQRAPQQQQQPQQQPRQNFEQRAPQQQQQQQPRQNFEQRAPQAQPQQQARPGFEQRAPQPQPQARPQMAAPPSAPRQAAPAATPRAEAPRGGGGGGDQHGHNH